MVAFFPKRKPAGSQSLRLWGFGGFGGWGMSCGKVVG